MPRIPARYLAVGTALAVTLTGCAPLLPNGASPASLRPDGSATRVRIDGAQAALSGPFVVNGATVRLNPGVRTCVVQRDGRDLLLLIDDKPYRVAGILAAPFTTAQASQPPATPVTVVGNDEDNVLVAQVDAETAVIANLNAQITDLNNRLTTAYDQISQDEGNLVSISIDKSVYAQIGFDTSGYDQEAAPIAADLKTQETGVLAIDIQLQNLQDQLAAANQELQRRQAALAAERAQTTPAVGSDSLTTLATLPMAPTAAVVDLGRARVSAAEVVLTSRRQQVQAWTDRLAKQPSGDTTARLTSVLDRLKADQAAWQKRYDEAVADLNAMSPNAMPASTQSTYLRPLVLDGGAGNDTVTVQGEGTLPAGSELRGGSGNDRLLTESTGLTLSGGDGNDTLLGSRGSDSLQGGDGDDMLIGRSGDDRLSGGSGNDRMSGGAGADALYGENGDDGLLGDDGPDTLDGGDGQDVLLGGDGNDTLAGGGGNDQLDGGSGFDRLSGDAGDDSLAGGPGMDSLTGGSGDDALDGGPGVDKLTGDTGSNAFFSDRPNEIKDLASSGRNVEGTGKRPGDLLEQTSRQSAGLGASERAITGGRVAADALESALSAMARQRDEGEDADRRR